MDIAAWLDSLGLGQYEQAFRDNEIDGDVLLELTGSDLSEMGVSAVGHRRRLLSSIEKLKDRAPSRQEAVYEQAGKAERRQMTILFCDIVSSTELVSRIDPEETRGVITSFMRAVEESCERHGGFVARFMGDGALVYFGYPSALENNAEAAANAGLDTLFATRELAWPDGSAVQMRVGIATGTVVVGDVIGQRAAREINVVGDTAHLAARLQSLADPGKVLIDERSRRLIGDLMALEPLGPHRLKGFDKPMQVWQVISRATSRNRFAALRAKSMSRFIGRDEPLSRLESLLAKTTEGKGAAATLCGEPGIGKSRLIHEVSHVATQRNMRVVSWFCSPDGGASAFAPIVDFFKREWDLDERGAEAAPQDLVPFLRVDEAHEDEAAALFERFLGVGGENALLQGYSLPRLRRRTMEILVEQMLGYAIDRPLLLVVEDYHWADPSTMELVNLLRQAIADQPVVLVLSYRPDIGDPWRDEADVLRLQLDRISQDAAVEFVDAIVGERQLDDAQIARIVERADGVPIFIEELTRAAMSGQGGPGEESVPDTLQDALMRRIDQLDAQRETVQSAAVIGREFQRELLGSVTRQNGDSIVRTVSAMVDGDIVTPVDGLSRSLYRFQHALVQDVLAGTLLREARQEIHRRIAEALVADMQAGNSHPPERIARHFDGGGLVQPAMGFYIQAGQQAIENFANVEAVAHLERALALNAKIEDPMAQAGSELGIRTLMGLATSMLKGWSAPEVGALYEKAQELWQKVGGHGEMFPIAMGLLAYRIVRGDLDEALTLANDTLKIAEDTASDPFALAAEFQVGAIRLYLGEVEVGEKHIDRSVTLFENLAYGRGLDLDATQSGINAIIHQSLIAAVRGEQAKTLKLTERSIELSREFQHAFTESFALMARASVRAMAYDIDGLLADIGEAMDFAKRQEFPHMISQVMAHHGWGLVMVGETASGLDMMQGGIAMWQGMGAGLRLCHYNAMLAEALLMAGDIESARSAINDAEAVLERTGEALFAPEILRIRGDVESATDAGAQSRETAIGTYREAMALAGKLGTGLFELRCGHRLAAQLLQANAEKEAKALLTDLADRFADSGLTWDLSEVARLRKVGV